jgi:hypothetical protein
MHPTPRPVRFAVATLAAAVTILTLGACSASDDSASTADGAAGGRSLTEQGGGDATTPDKAAEVGPEAAEPGAAGSGRVDAAAALAQQKLTRRADVSLEVDDLSTSATKVRSIATAAGGLVVAEEVSGGPRTPPEDVEIEPGFGTVTISVPSEKLDATLDELAKIGTVVARTSSTEDVTATYVDTTSRVESMKASVERVRALMSQATKLAEIVSLEAELSRRQADLEALQTQLAALDDAVALSPVTVRMSTDTDALTEDDDTGFLAGLTAGWGAFTASVTVLLTALGALLPFAVVLTVVLVPLVMWLRRRVRTVPPTASMPAPVPPPAA